MTTTRRERGRPARPYPPRIDATPEQIANVVLNAKPQGQFFDKPDRTEYRCADCQRAVNYPETLYRDGRCKACHAAHA